MFKVKLKPSKKPMIQFQDSAWATTTLKHFGIVIRKAAYDDHLLLFTKEGSDLEITLPKKDLPGLSHCHCGKLTHTGKCGRFHFYEQIIKPFAPNKVI